MSVTQEAIIKHLLKYHHYTFVEFVINIYTLNIIANYLIQIGVSHKMVVLIMLLV